MTLEAEQSEGARDELDRLRADVAELRAARGRLVLAADADCRRIERALHEGVQQQLVALAVKLQLAGPLVEADPAAARALLEEMRRDVQEGLDAAARLAERIHPQFLETGGLAAALRAAAVSAGVPASVDVSAGSIYEPEIARTVYLVWLEALEHAAGESRATVILREKEGALTFELAADESGATLDGLRERIEALGGRLTVESDPERGIRLRGSLPLST
jgi:signal transduction histidine kinase